MGDGRGVGSGGGRGEAGGTGEAVGGLDVERQVGAEREGHRDLRLRAWRRREAHLRRRVAEVRARSDRLFAAQLSRRTPDLMIFHEMSRNDFIK
jgi:hypothetical protein